MFTRCASAGQVERAAAVAPVHAVQGVHQSDAVGVVGRLVGLQVKSELMTAHGSKHALKNSSWGSRPAPEQEQSGGFLIRSENIMFNAPTAQRFTRTVLALSASLFLLAACGGGGSSATSGPVSSTLSFPLQSGYRALLANGYAANFTISGTCTGSGSHTVGAANTAATFEGTSALSAASTLTMNLIGCTPATAGATSTSYYDINYIPRGFSSVGVNYGVYLTAPFIPSTVSVGNTGTIGTETLYTNSTKAVSNGIDVSSYVVEPDTANTAIINLITRSYNSGGTLIFTEQDRYRIQASGTLSRVSSDIQYSSTSSTHLVLTF